MDYHDIKAEADDGAVGTSYGKSSVRNSLRTLLAMRK